MFDELARVNKEQAISNGQLIFNDKEIEAMMNIYAQCDREYGLEGDDLINLPYEERRKSRGQKLWEKMTFCERKHEFFNALKMDLESVSRQIVNISRVHYIENRSFDPLDPMAGFYKCVLVKLGGATINEDGKIKILRNLEEHLENLELPNKRIIDLISAGGIDRFFKFKPEEVKLREGDVAIVDDFAKKNQGNSESLSEHCFENVADEAHVVELKTNADRSKAIVKGGIDIGRPGLYGNPSAFGTTRDTDVMTLVEKYREWLMGKKYQEVEPDRRRQILDSILKGELNGKGLVCYAHGGGTCHGDVLADFVKNKLLVQKALKLPEQGINGEGGFNDPLQESQKLKYDPLSDRGVVHNGEIVMFEEIAGANHEQGLVNGHLIFNDKEIEAMMNIYAQYAIGYNLKLDKTNQFYQVHRKFIGQKLWEDMTMDERKDEFFKALKNDIEITSKQVLGENKINYLLDRALDTLDPMAGFYKCVLLKLGATITEDEKIKLSLSMKEQFENYELHHKRTIDLMSEAVSDQSLKVIPSELKLGLKLKLD